MAIMALCVSHVVHQHFLPEKFCLSVRLHTALAARGTVLYSTRHFDFGSLRRWLRGPRIWQGGLPRAALTGFSPFAKLGQTGNWSV